MSFTNSTTNYGLPQYINTDIPSYLVDQNGAWATIDSALKSASDDATQAINDASTADGKAVTAQTDASSALTKANGALSNIADAFDSTSTYSVGDRVIYNAILYVCSTAVTIPGAFDPINWTRETIEEEIDDIKSDIITINSNLSKNNITVTYASGYVKLGASANIAYVEDGVCHLSLTAYGAFSSGTYQYPITLPVGARPTSTIYFPCIFINSGGSSGTENPVAGLCEIGSNGNVLVMPTNSATVSTCVIHVEFPVA